MRQIRPLDQALDWLTPSHPKWPSKVKTLMSTRIGGHSMGAYASLNLGDHVGDDSVLVQKNREQLELLTGNRPVYLKQIHGCEVVFLSPTTPNGTQADVCLTTHKNLSCTIMVADCLPILMTNMEGTIVGAAHAGWRGLAGMGSRDGRGVIENLITSLIDHQALSRAPTSGWLAWLGPCIGAKHFEVGIEVVEAFSGDTQAEDFFNPLSAGPSPQKWMADLAGLARLRLQRLGVETILGNSGGLDSDMWCTYIQKDLFFSHRRDKVSGRMAASIWIT